MKIINETKVILPMHMDEKINDWRNYKRYKNTNFLLVNVVIGGLRIDEQCMEPLNKKVQKTT